MAVSGSRVTIATTATVIYDVSDPGAASIIIRNAGANSIFLGGSGVTTATGYELTTGTALGFDLKAGDDLYGIVAAATERLDVLRLGA